MRGSNPPCLLDYKRSLADREVYYTRSLEIAVSGKIRWQISSSISVAIVAGFVFVAEYKACNPKHLPWIMMDQRYHLGAEIDCVARALVKGRGFSDPFCEETGPTAWVPPVLPYFLAALYWLSYSNDIAVIAPNPGITPINVPSDTPKTQNMRLLGSIAVDRPRATFSSKTELISRPRPSYRRNWNASQCYKEESGADS